MKIRFINTKEVVDVDISTCTTVGFGWMHVIEGS